MEDDWLWNKEEAGKKCSCNKIIQGRNFNMFIRDEVEYIKTNYQEIEALIQKHFSRCFDQTQDIPVGMICICFMNTSLYFQKPVYRICFYREDTIWENPILEHELPADWLFHEWNYDYKNEEELVEMRKQIRPLLIYASAIFKYSLAKCYQFSNYRKMNRAQELYLCYGEYKDWQFPIYIDRPEIDIFNNVNEEPLTFRRFDKKVYRNKVFNNLDLTSCVFSDCDFQKVTFRNTILNDTIFENCRFEEVSYEDCKLYGATHKACSFRSVNHHNTAFWLEQPTPKSLTGIYRECSFVHCDEEAVDYGNSNMEGVVMV